MTLTGSGSDVDGPTPLTFSWTPATGLVPHAGVAQPTFTPLDNGMTTFTLAVCDDTTPPACDATPDTMTVTATNVAPQVTAPTDQSVIWPCRSAAPLPSPIPGPSDTHSAIVGWGDNSEPQTLDGVTTGFGIAHTYTSPGVYDVTVCVTDDDGGEGCDTFTLTIFDGEDPVAVDDEDTTAEDTPVPIFVLEQRRRSGR